jgi:NAD(P)-dependent dehydrogenase (short-subunit alcohol dehydrogenase family)
LKGQVGVVTGGGRGLGAALAEALAKEGMSLALAGRSGPALERTAAHLEEQGSRVLAIPTDVTKRPEVDELVRRVEESLGPVDLLVNNAGMTAFGNLWESDPETWWRVQEVNLLGPFLCSRAVLRGMVARRSGRIVNVGSYVANGPSADQPAYAVSKAALVRLTDSTAAQVAELGIRVFAISPGLLKTEMGLEVMKRRGMVAGAQWVPTSLAAGLVLSIASGALDSLSGRFIHAQDDLGELLDRHEEIEAMDLYQLRLGRLPPAREG